MAQTEIGTIFVHAPEDLIINKVAYFGLSQQTKHIRDIASILVSMEAGEFDWPYFKGWVTKLGLSQAWQQVEDEIDRLVG